MAVQAHNDWPGRESAHFMTERRLVRAFRWIGVDLSAIAMQFRRAVLRPYLADLELARRLDKQGSEVAATLSQLAGRLAQIEATAAGASRRIDEIEADLAPKAARLRELEAKWDADAGTRLQVVASSRQTTAAMQAELDRLTARANRLERLITHSQGARAPGEARAVAALGKPAIAVIIPTHSRPAIVGEAIQSVRAQSYPDWELVVVDDGGASETAVAPYLDDSRIRYLPQAHAGSAVARNLGIASTSAPLITYLDDDNLYYPDFLAAAVAALATSPEIDLVYGALVTSHHSLPGGSEVLLEPFDRKRLEWANFIDTSTIVHRRSLVERYGGWDATLPTLRDWDLVLRYTQDRPGRSIDVLATYYRQVDDNRMSTSIAQGATYEAIRARWGGRAPGGPD